MRQAGLANAGSYPAAPATAAASPAVLSSSKDMPHWAVYLVIAWTLFEIGRPPLTPPGGPMLIALTLCTVWLFTNNKQLDRLSLWWVVLLFVIGFGITFAPNSYAVAMSTRAMIALFFGACLPLQASLTTPKRLHIWVWGLLLIGLYANGWASAHGGYGPSGADGAQDENYMAALAGMVIPFAYFSFFITRKTFHRVVLTLVIIVCVASIAVGINPSRGGFLGLGSVALYCLMRSPKKWKGIAILTIAGAALAAIAGPEFWAEIKTTTDTTSGTGFMRLEVWKAGWRMFVDNPVLGVGAGNFRWVIGDYQTPQQIEIFGRSLAGSIIAHSMPVELAAELGSIGVIATLALTYNAWRGLSRVRDAIPANTPNHDLAMLRCYSDAIRASILAIWVNGTFLSLLYNAHLWLLVATGAAVPFIYARVMAQQPAALPADSPAVTPVASLPAPPFAAPPGRGGLVRGQFSRGITRR